MKERGGRMVSIQRSWSEFKLTNASGRTTKTMGPKVGFWSAKTKIIKIEGFVSIGGNIHAI
jgi:hypothetical protein